VNDDDARARLHGVWELVEYRDRASPEDPWYYPYGHEPAGVFHYHPDGHLSVHVYPGTDAPDGSEYLGYFGRYVIREIRQEGDRLTGVVEHHMVGASAPFLFDHPPDRPFTFERHELTIGVRDLWIRRFVRPTVTPN
jgi:hypothetical protein